MKLAPKEAVAAWRTLYTSEVEKLKEVGKKLLTARGRSPEQVANVAKTLNQMRIDIGIKFKNMTPPDLLEWIYEFNELRYGNKLGPTYEFLRRTKSDMEIIEGASRPMGEIKKLGAAMHELLGPKADPVLRKYGMLD